METFGLIFGTSRLSVLSLYIFECRCAVATLALRAERFMMHIVSFMAVNAAGTKCRHCFPRFGVTGMAAELAMSAVECEVCALVMLEIPDAPVSGVMAGRAGGTQAALVHVLLVMTGGALLFRIPELDSGVTFGACDL